MDEDGKRRPETQIVPAKKGKPAVVKWKLTDEDIEFLRSCNIRPA